MFLATPLQLINHTLFSNLILICPSSLPIYKPDFFVVMLYFRHSIL